MQVSKGKNLEIFVQSLPEELSGSGWPVRISALISKSSRKTRPWKQQHSLGEDGLNSTRGERSRSKKGVLILYSLDCGGRGLVG